jgi:hypothetical protein
MHKGKLTNVNPPRITTEPILPHLCTDDKQIQCTDNINF